MFSLLDVIIILIVFAFTVAGWLLGFFHTLGALIGTAAGAYVSSRVGIPLGEWIGGQIGAKVAVTIIAFLLVFLIVSRLVGFVFWLIERAFKLLSVLPFLKTINRLLGATLGFAEGLLVIASVVYVAKLVFPDESIAAVVDSSKVAVWMLATFTFILSLLPETLRTRVNELL